MREFANYDLGLATECGCAELSLVIPVYNAGATIGWLVDQIHAVLRKVDIEVVLVNDGSKDNSEGACLLLVEKYPDTVRYVHLARNFGEHNAVLAGLRHAIGKYVAVLDDDGQNPPHEVLRMYEHAWQHDLDVVFGRYRSRRHSWLRRLGSWFSDQSARLALGKPKGVHLSSFKVMSRFVVDEITTYNGPLPYVDALILRTTDRIGEIGVSHCERRAGRSGYTLGKLVRLWSNMFLGFSVAPLKLGLAAGSTAAALALLVLIAVAGRRMLDSQLTAAFPSTLACVIVVLSAQLLMLGLLGAYVGRLYLHQNAGRQYVVRYCRQGERAADAMSETHALADQTSPFPAYSETSLG